MKHENKLQDYKTAGAWMRLCKEVIAETKNASWSVTDHKDQTMIETALTKISIACSRIEDRMFAEYPGFIDGACDVFYGNLLTSPRTETDSDQIRLAQELAINLFGQNWNADLLDKADK